MKRWTFATLLVFTALMVPGSPRPSRGAELERFEFEEKHMGTLFRVVLYAPDAATAQTAAREGFARVKSLNDTMTDYDPASELMQLCKKFSREVGDPVGVSDDLDRVLRHARQLSESSGGAFDVTVGPVVKLWRVSRRTQKLPDPRELQDALSRVGWEKLELLADPPRVRLRTPGMQLDLGGIAKGFAADEVIARLKKRGIEHALVAAGGDITVSKGPPGSDGWKVEIAPLPGSPTRRRLRLENAAVSTSGDTENFVVIDGVRYSHIVDPKTGVGLTGSRSVTVIAPRGIVADSTTKAAMILPPEKALKLIDAMEGVSALILKREGTREEKVESKGFAKYLIQP